MLSDAAIKHAALGTMVAQNAAFVLVMRYSRQQQATSNSGSTYNVAMVVALQEVFKLVLCVVIMTVQARSLKRVGAALARPLELVRICVPATCFTLQARCPPTPCPLLHAASRHRLRGGLEL